MITPQTMKKYNIKSYREVADGLLVVSSDLDEWIIRDTILLHRDARNNRGNVSFHRQREIKNINEALKYICSHTKKYKKPLRRSRIEYLFSII